jgi:TRAP-type C4-dicarboxylate transport system permease small subunit
MMLPDAVITYFCKPILALSFAGTTFIANTITPHVQGIPEWVTALGLPVAFLVAVIYALISTNRALRQSEEGRRQDWENHSKKLEEMMNRGNESRERLIRATDLQTLEFKSLADQLRRSTS